MGSKTFCPHGVWDEHPCRSCEDELHEGGRIYAAERAVIEAARACVQDIEYLRNRRDPSPKERRAIALLRAIEALDAAEKGGE